MKIERGTNTVHVRVPAESCRRSLSRRLASSSSGVGTRTSRHTVLSPWSKDRNIRTMDSASSRSVLARRLPLLTKKLVESSTGVRMPRFSKNLANQKPSYPASKHTTMSAGRPSIYSASACVLFNINTSAAVSPHGEASRDLSLAKTPQLAM